MVEDLYKPDSLVAKIFKDCYFPDSSFSEAKATKSSSFLWKSLVWGRELIEKVSRWRVGNGRSIRIYRDRWIPRLFTFKIYSPPMLGVIATVDMLKSHHGMWNEALMR